MNNLADSTSSITKGRLNRAFKEREANQKLMNLFVTAGFPHKEATVPLIKKLEENGADIIELGMPYSDPLADGPTIQQASEQALKEGVTLDGIFDMVAKIREESGIPIVLMGYINPVLHYGIEAFCKKASESGVDGLIIPDIPPEEAHIIRDSARANGLSLVYLVAPNTPDERMRRIDSTSEGFVYCVSVTGVTGAREGDEVYLSVNRFIDRVVANVTQNPRLIGFGIKNHEDAMRISEKVEGFIVGSAVIKNIQQHYPDSNWMEQVGLFVNHLKHG